jgi:hypothetical protein
MRKEADLTSTRHYLSCHIALTDCLTLDTARVDGLFLRVFTDDLHNRKHRSSGHQRPPGKGYTSPFPYLAPVNLGR